MTTCKTVLKSATSLVALTGAIAGAFAVTSRDAAAQGLEVSLNGFYNTLVIARDQDGGASTADPRAYDINSRGRYSFNAAYTLDNGLTVGFDSQHEIQSNFETERSYAYLSGGFGQVEIGNMESAAYQLHTEIGGAGWGIDDTSHTDRIVEPQATSATTVVTYPYGIGDSEFYINPRLTYFTPRISGFQAGVSFTPDNTRGADAARFVTDKAALGADAIEDIVSLGLNYANTYGALDLSVSGGAEFGSVNDTGAGVLSDDYAGYSAGAGVGFAGWAVGAAYAYRNMAIDGADRHDLGGSVTYAVGPWTLGPSLGYVSEDGVDASGKEELYVYELGANYAMGPGVDLRASALYADWDSNDPTRDGDGLGVGAGLALSF